MKLSFALMLGLLVVIQQVNGQGFCNFLASPFTTSIPGHTNDLPKDYFNFWLGPIIAQATMQPFPPIPVSVQQYIERESDFYYDLLTQSALINGFDFAPLFINSGGVTGDPNVDASPTGALLKQYQTRDIIQSTLSQFLSFVPISCGQAFIKFFIGSQMPRPYQVDQSITFFFPNGMGGFIPFPSGAGYYFGPSFPCKHSCLDVRQMCPPEILATFPLCNETLASAFPAGFITGLFDFCPSQDLFPDNKTQYYIATTNLLDPTFFNVDIPCTDYSEVEFFTYTPPCQYPLGLNEEAFYNNGLPCQDHCLGYLFYTEHEWHVTKVILGTIGWASFLTTTYLAITLLISPKNRRYPGMITVFIAIGTSLVNITFSVGACTGLEEILCSDKFTPADFDHGPCAWQAAFMIFGSLLGFLMWTAISANTFFTLSLRWKLDPVRWGIATMVICIGYPTIIMSVMLGIEEVAYSAPTPWCWYSNSDLEWALFYAILISVTLFNLIAVSCVIWELRNIQDSSKGKRAKYMKVARVACFLIIFLEISLYLIAMQSLSFSRTEQYQQVTGAYARCLYTNALDPCPMPADGEGIIALSQWYALNAHVTGQGFAVFLVFGTTSQIFFFWCRAVNNLAHGRGVFEDIMESQTGQSSSSSASWAGQNEFGEDSYDPDQN